MDIIKAKNKRFAIAMTLTIFLIIGIPLIIVGAIFGGVYFTIMGFGILLTVLGFYGTPIAWTTYGNFKRDVNIAESINTDGIREISVICNLYGLTPKVAYDTISKLIQKRYVKNLIFNASGTELILNEGYVNLDREKQLKSSKRALLCPFCGAQVELVGYSGKCPYCGNLVESEALNAKKYRFCGLTVSSHNKSG